MTHCCSNDSLDPQMAASDSEPKSANTWVHSVFLNRLNNPATGAVIVTGQRLHQMDTFGLLLEAEPATWRHVAVPMEAEADTDIVLPKSGRIWHRPKGDILLPQRFSPQEIQNRKAQPFVWASQNQQHPVRPEGNLLRWQMSGSGVMAKVMSIFPLSLAGSSSAATAVSRTPSAATTPQSFV